MYFRIFAAAALAALCASSARGQDSVPAPGAATSLATIGGASDQALRLGQLLGHEPAGGGYLLRSPSSATPRRGDGIRVLVPEADLVWNSRIPHSLNDGPLWAGRGANGRLMAGIEAVAGPVRLIAAPEVVWSQNEAFDDLLPVDWTPEERARYVAPWTTGVHSADLPWRYGDQPVRTLLPGQSSLTVDAGPVALGAATENQWWGPGVRNAILFSNNAAGFPHLFLRTGRPLRTALGQVEGRWIAGALSASPYFAGGQGESGRRSVSALGLTLAPGAAPGLTLGIARTVYAPVDGWGQAAGRFADVLGHWSAGRDSTGPAAEQMLALSARWVLPADGAELYVEWARRELPASLRDVLEQPEHTQGYTMGGQLARPLGARVLRLLGELTYLEKSATYRARPTGSFYASARVPEGYTERGQVVGAGIGPGASSQWLGADLLGRGLEGGVFAGRIRWQNDAYYDKPGGNTRYRGHEVSLLGGARASVGVGGARLSAEWTGAKRLNYLFQNYAVDWHLRDNAVDVVNHTLRLQLSAAPRVRLPRLAAPALAAPVPPGSTSAGPAAGGRE
ncbi:MAG: capsule assembly Wzi family protein [Gemmatimonadetes bacterium]|nr:capsule assembly Wzi family protein [Gemmatimonadota bacterium]